MTSPVLNRSLTGLARVMAVTLMVAAIAACSSAPRIGTIEEPTGAPSFQPTETAASGGVRPTSKQSSQEVERIFAQYSVPDSMGGGAVDYRLAPMDIVDVAVYEAPNLSRTAQVSAAGYISLPLLGNVRASGKTTDQLQQDIAARLRRNFMQSPQVFVSVKEYNSQRVTVDGAVKAPGVYPLKGETTLLQMIVTAGGLNEMGSPSGVFILRKMGGKKMAARFDLNEIRKGQKPDPMLRAGDIVMVDESGGKVVLRGLREAMGFTGMFSMLLL